MSKSKSHEIVILGGHFGGLGVAHYLLRHIIPSLSKLTPTTEYHITIVSPHSEFFYNIAAPRHIAGENLVSAKQIFTPIAPGFEQYSSDQYTFLTGKAIAVSGETKTVTVSGNTAGQQQELKYNTLVLATGTTSNSALWQVNEDQEVTKGLYRELHTLLPKAKTILIAGGGAVGVETTGEISTHYSSASITLLSGTDRLLPRLAPGTSATAEKKLKKLNVKTVHNLRVKASSKNADGTTSLKLDDGTEKVVDVFIDATGGKPNSSFLPSAWVDAKGYVLTDDKTFRSTVAGSVYAIGDVASSSDGSFMNLTFQVGPVCVAIGKDIAAAAGNENLFKPKAYKPLQETQFVPIGPSGGVAQVMGWRLPSWVVWLVKSRTFFVEKAGDAVKGADQAKA